MKLTYDNTRTREQREISDAGDIGRKTPAEIFEELYEKQNNRTMTEEQREFVTERIGLIWGNK